MKDFYIRGPFWLKPKVSGLPFPSVPLFSPAWGRKSRGMEGDWVDQFGQLIEGEQPDEDRVVASS